MDPTRSRQATRRSIARGPGLFWIGGLVFCLAWLVRFGAYWWHGREGAFTKYTDAAQQMSEGGLAGVRVLDFSPAYLELNRALLAVGVSDLDVLRIGQCTLAAITCVLIAHIGGTLAGRFVALCAGLLAAFQRDLVVYASVLEPDALLLFFSVAAVACIVGVWHRPHLQVTAAAVLAGLSVATRPSALLLGIVLAGACLHRARRESAAVWSLALCFVLGFGGVVGLTELRNQSHGEGASMSPWQVFYTGNNPAASGLFREDFLVKDIEKEEMARGSLPDQGHEIYRQLAVVSGADAEHPDLYWRELSLAFVREHPGRAAELLLSKWLALGQAHSPPDIMSVFLFGRGVAHRPLVSMPFLAAIGCLGLLLFKRTRFPAALAACQVAVCSIFFVSARHRLHLLPWLCVGGAVLIYYVWLGVRRAWRQRTWLARPTLLVCLGTLGLWFGFLAPLPPAHADRWHFATQAEAHELFQQAVLEKRGNRLQAAGRTLGDAYFSVPWADHLPTLPLVPFPLTELADSLLPRAKGMAEESGTPQDWLRLAVLEEHARKTDGALRTLERVVASCFYPGESEFAFRAQLRRGRLLLRSGESRAAQSAFRAAESLRPGSPRALVGLAASGAGPEHLVRAERLSPGLEVAYFHGRLALGVGLPAEALEPLERLVAAVPRYGRGRLLLATALFETGRLQAALVELSRAREFLPFFVDPLCDPVAILRAAATSSGTRRAWRGVALLAELHGDFEGASTAWQRVEAAGALTPEDEVRLGWLYLRHGRFTDALLRLRPLAKQKPRVPFAREGVTLARRGTRGLEPSLGGPPAGPHPLR